MDEKQFRRYLIIFIGVFFLDIIFDNIILDGIVGWVFIIVLFGGVPIVWYTAVESSKKMGKNKIRFIQFIWLLQVLCTLLLLSGYYNMRGL
ncbi:hypothetical protein ACFL2R_02785 [Patescibacteria group bacterium]